jgi:F-type H+-transporting ATPase subunit a
MMLLAEMNLIEHVSDHPIWQVQLGGMTFTVMSSGIAAMILVAVLLVVAIVPLARRVRMVPAGASGALELVVIFVRDLIARPALHDKAYNFLPFLLTMFVFVLGMNLIGLVPLEGVTQLVSLTGLLNLPKIGFTPTSILTVTAALAAISFAAIVLGGVSAQARHAHDHYHWPWVMAIAAGPLLWFKSLSPPLPGLLGKILLVPLGLLELVGVVAKSFALMIRLFANMVSGHVLLAVLLMFIVDSAATVHVWYVGPATVIFSVLISLLEVMVAFLQAYIITFLTAMFLGLYVEPAH